MKRILPIIALAVLITASAAHAQSLFSTRGLGVPVAPLDARARALGAVGTGLFGLNTSLVNPAEITGAYSSGIAVGMQPAVNSARLDDRASRVGGTRFPLVHVLYPVGTRLVAGLGHGGVLDQTWSIDSESVELLGGDSVRVRDRIAADGGVSELRFSLAYRASPALALGAAAGVFTGSITHSVTRSFPDASAGGLTPFTTRARREFRGPTAAVGARWDPATFLRLAGSVAWGGELEADSVEGDAVDRTFDMPWRVSAGGSADLAPRLTATLGGRWTGWESTEGGFIREDVAADAWRLGGGLEWAGPRFGDRNLPVRAGFHYGRLPFKMEGTAPAEWAMGLGLGFRLAGQPARPAAVIDASVERGGRGDADATRLTEDFWRFTISMALFGL